MPITETTFSKRGSQGKRPGAVYVHMGVWYDPKTTSIHLTAPKEPDVHTRISNNPKSIRYQPKFFAQLKRLLERYNRWPGG